LKRIVGTCFSSEKHEGEEQDAQGVSSKMCGEVPVCTCRGCPIESVEDLAENSKNNRWVWTVQMITVMMLLIVSALSKPKLILRAVKRRSEKQELVASPREVGHGVARTQGHSSDAANRNPAPAIMIFTALGWSDSEGGTTQRARRLPRWDSSSYAGRALTPLWAKRHA